ncbi:Uncharacterised protein [Morganella morganii]|nr:Uncharacterised protein [Morganella morganii]
MKDINFIVGQNIRDLRHRNGLTTKMLAKMLGGLTAAVVKV